MFSWSLIRKGRPQSGLKSSHSRDRRRFRLFENDVAEQRTLPVVFMVVSREQAIAAEDAEFFQWTDDILLESLLVAQILRDTVGGREEHFPGRVDSHQGACQNGCLSRLEKGVEWLMILPPSIP